MQHFFLYAEAFAQSQISARALVGSNAWSAKKNSHRSMVRPKVFSQGLQPCFLCSLAWFQGHVSPSGPGLHPPLPPAHKTKNFLLLIWSPPALQCCRVEDVISLTPCHKISQEESFVPSLGVDLFFLVWFLLSLPLTVLDLGFFQRRRWGVEDRESVYSMLSQTLQCDYSPMFL